MRFFASISYNGSGLSGWQIQDNAPSVQAEVQRALSAALGEKITVVGAGRTDTGVNASDFTAHFDTDSSLVTGDPAQTIYKINAILPKNIVLHDIVRVRDDAHARFDADSRTYRYYVHSRKDPFVRDFSWYCKFPLDVEAMNRGAELLLGRHDFSCFEKTGSAAASPECEVTAAGWSCWTPVVAPMPGDTSGYLVFTITANRFLRNMVRAIVGTLIEVGRGRQEPGWVADVMVSRDRCRAGQSVPGHALFLTDVHYPEEIFDYNS